MKNHVFYFPGFATNSNFLTHYLPNTHIHPITSTTCTSIEMLQQLKPDSKKIYSVIGLSLGAYRALEVCNPSMPIDKLLLFSCRPHYPKSACRLVKQQLKKNTHNYLKAFYEQCFFNKDTYNQFKHNTEKNWLTSQKYDSLCADIDELESRVFDEDKFRLFSQGKLIHGEFDTIAPLSDWQKTSMMESIHIVKKSGHLDVIPQYFNDNLEVFTPNS